MAARVSPAQIAAMAQAHGLDPQAVLAVAEQEGLGGGIGDRGTSFGPFQLHYGGAYPSSAPRGAAASQAWAWSPEGVNYALNQIQGVAGGLSGPAAVSAIVSRFERPADPGSEIQGALSSYGHANVGSAGMPTQIIQSLPASAVPKLLPLNSMPSGGLLAGSNLGSLNLLGSAAAALGFSTPRMPAPLPPSLPVATQMSVTQPGVTATGPVTPGHYPNLKVVPTASITGLNPRLLSGLQQLGRIYGPISIQSGYRSPSYSAKVGGYANDPHSRGEAVDAYINGKPIGEVIPLDVLARYGLQGGNQPGFYQGKSDPEHVQIPGSGVDKSMRSPLLGQATGVPRTGNVPPSFA